MQAKGPGWMAADFPPLDAILSNPFEAFSKLVHGTEGVGIQENFTLRVQEFQTYTAVKIIVFHREKEYALICTKKIPNQHPTNE